MKDFTPTEQIISLHGLGFMQLKLPENRRLHIWHPDLPRRQCFNMSAIHNHRFAFRSLLLKGIQVNRRFNVIKRPDDTGEYIRINHDGPRSPKGGRESFIDGSADISPMVDEIYVVGQSYEMPVGQYHETPNGGIVVTLMKKLIESERHASSLIKRGSTFDQDFDRYQLPQSRLWAIAGDALNIDLKDF